MRAVKDFSPLQYSVCSPRFSSSTRFSRLLRRIQEFLFLLRENFQSFAHVRWADAFCFCVVFACGVCDNRAKNILQEHRELLTSARCHNLHSLLFFARHQHKLLSRLWNQWVKRDTLCARNPTRSFAATKIKYTKGRRSPVAYRLLRTARYSFPTALREKNNTAK